MKSLSLRALVSLKLLVLFAFWSFGPARTAVPLPPGALARVQSDNGDGGDLFGAAVALSRDGRVLVVGADQEGSRSAADGGDNGLPGAGAAYVFERDGDHWRQSAYLKAPTPTPGGGFGFAVAVSDDGQTIAVGAPFEPGASSGSGGVHLFTRGGAQWSSMAHLPAPQGIERFGVGIDLSDSGAELAVASFGPLGESMQARAAHAHVFEWRAGRWAPGGVMTLGMADAVGALPRVALAGDGRRVALSNGGEAVRLFEHSVDGWALLNDELAAATAGPAPVVQAMALSSDGRTLAVARAHGGVDVHAQPSASAWALQVHLRAAPDGPALGHRLALSADGSSLAVGAADDAPAVYRFRRHAGQWQALPPLMPAGDWRGLFGSALALSPDGRTLAVGSRFEPVSRWPWPFAPARAAGAVHLYTPA